MIPSTPNPDMQSVIRELLEDLHAEAGCDQVGLTQESFAIILTEIGAKHAGSASPNELRTFFLSLRLDELALARACAAGHNSAWEIFLTRFREKLYLSALRIAREDSRPRTCRYPLRRPLRHQYSGGSARLETRFLYRSRISRG